MEYIEYLIIVVVLVVIAFAILKSKNKNFKIEANKLVEYLGGRDNIIEYSYNRSRFTVKLKNISIANKDMIQKLGAQGIVEVDNQLKIILGDDAKQLIKYIDELK
ncbi:MAG: PTS transporter subunit EIIB [Bacilli bacterium]|nr:PTS transporter subunit EIIB [Bacilli bacterium]